ncbi:MAG: hypothetical protein J5851_01995 [Oscillospiraceae bacterium]|nr:hypothetical protein [Oscillospiraceae bacterium]
MDQFAEQLVKKHPSTKDDLRRGLIIAGAAVITLGSVALVFLGYPIALVLPVCAIWAAIYLFRLTNVEYEYSVTNGSLDIDKILGQNKRKSMLSVEVSTFTVYGKVDEVTESDADMTTFLATGTSLMGEDDDAEEYYAEFDHGEHGKCCLYFTPDSRFREALEPFLSRSLRQDVARRRSQ